MTMFTAASTSTQAPRATHSGIVHLFNVWRQRQVLRKLDSAALTDIGLSRDEAVAESRRPFWDAPSTWRC